MFLKFETLNISSSNDFKILGKSKDQNLQNLIKLNVLQSLDGRRYSGSEHIPFVQPEISIHTITANKEKKAHMTDDNYQTYLW